MFKYIKSKNISKIKNNIFHDIYVKKMNKKYFLLRSTHEIYNRIIKIIF
jgi:hypothetical protein